MAVTGYRAEDDSCFTVLQKEKQRVRIGRGPWLIADIGLESSAPGRSEL